MRYGRREAAWKLSVSIRSVDYLIARKVLDTRKDGKRIFITHASLVRYAATNHYGAFAGEKADVTDAVETDAVETGAVETDAVDLTDVAA
jgi:hypothetical protein